MSHALVKRGLDIGLSSVGLLVSAPILLMAMAVIWIDDRGAPLYIGTRIGRGGTPFRMYKLRTMRMHADSSQVDTTAKGDPRITSVGALLRKIKADELPQLVNVIKGDMSLVGPRPNVGREVDLYTDEERGMLGVRPGVTDLSSIVFSDLDERIGEVEDANLAYNQLIRPWKSRLSLLGVRHASLGLDLKIIWWTVLAVLSKPAARRQTARLVTQLGGDPRLPGIILGHTPLTPSPPPGATEIVTSR